MAKKKAEVKLNLPTFKIGELVSLVGTPYKYYITCEIDGKYGLGNKVYSEPFRMVTANEIAKLEETKVEVETVEHLPEVVESEEDVFIEECSDDGDECVL